MRLNFLFFVLLLSVCCPQSILGFPLDDYSYEDDVKNKTCGGLYKDLSGGDVKSPNYPNYYGAGRDCEYMFHAPKGYVVHITFVVFDIDDQDNADNCVYDRVHVHDGPNATFPALGKAMCGTKRPESVMSSGRYLTVFLHTGEDSAYGHGFHLEYRMVKDDQRSKTCIMNSCGGDFENFVGCEIQTPNYPFTYLPSQHCVWVMHAPGPNDRFKVNFKTLKVESSINCVLNNLTLHDGKTEEDAIIQKVLCKEMDVTHGQLFMTTGPYLRMVFKSQNETLAERSDHTYDFDHLMGVAADIELIPGAPADTTSTEKPVATTTPAPTSSTTTITTTKTTTEESDGSDVVVKSTVKPLKPTTKAPQIVPQNTNETTGAMSGLVIGVIIGLLVIVLLILIVVAFVHWKRQNYRIRLRTEDDQNVLISNMDGDMAEVNFRKSSGRIVRNSQNRDSTLSDAQL